MSVFFISDLHFGHENMAIHRGFANADEMNQHIITQWNSIVHKRDCVYILGDITMEKSREYPMLNLLKGDKNIVLGNHDMKNHVQELLKYVQSVAGMTSYKKEFILTHCPIHPQELDFKFKWNIHGHNHDKRVMKYDGLTIDSRYINVACERLNYKPIEFNELKQIYCK